MSSRVLQDRHRLRRALCALALACAPAWSALASCAASLSGDARAAQEGFVVLETRKFT